MLLPIADSALGVAPCVRKQRWALTRYLHFRIAGPFNTAHLAGPGGTRRAAGGRKALIRTSSVTDILYSNNLIWDAKFGIISIFLYSLQKELRMYPKILISWLFFPPLFGDFFNEVPAGQRGWCWMTLFTKPCLGCLCLDANAEVKYNPSTHPKQMLETCLSPAVL